MNTLLQAFARLPEAAADKPDYSGTILTFIFVAFSFAAGMAAGLFFARRDYKAGKKHGYLEGWQDAIKPAPPAQTIKIAPRNVPIKSPFTVSQPGDLPTDMGWHSNSREIK